MEKRTRTEESKARQSFMNSVEDETKQELGTIVKDAIEAENEENVEEIVREALKGVPNGKTSNKIKEVINRVSSPQETMCRIYLIYVILTGYHPADDEISQDLVDAFNNDGQQVAPSISSLMDWAFREDWTGNRMSQVGPLRELLKKQGLTDVQINEHLAEAKAKNS